MRGVHLLVCDDEVFVERSRPSRRPERFREFLLLPKLFAHLAYVAVEVSINYYVDLKKVFALLAQPD